MIIILAHGALGYLDEIIFLGIAAIFIGIMGLTWVRSQQAGFAEDDGKDQPPARKSRTRADDQSPDRFKLD